MSFRTSSVFDHRMSSNLCMTFNRIFHQQNHGKWILLNVVWNFLLLGQLSISQCLFALRLFTKQYFKNSIFGINNIKPNTIQWNLLTQALHLSSWWPACYGSGRWFVNANRVILSELHLPHSGQSMGSFVNLFIFSALSRYLYPILFISNFFD